MKPVRLLAIAGSDSSGGAGIQADIKTATAFGAYAMTAVTAVTAQDTTGIGDIQMIPASLVREQIERCLGDIGADAIKIGMLCSVEIVEAVAAVLSTRAASIPTIVDPVMQATTGTALADDGTIDALRAMLFSGAALVTPNLPEAERLCGFSPQTSNDLLRAGTALLAMGPKAVLLKGGHGGSETITDLLFTPNSEPRAYIAKRVDTIHTHGTGCTLSTAIACGLGEGMPLGDAVQRAHDFVQRAIRTAPGFGAGGGPINHLQK